MTKTKMKWMNSRRKRMSGTMMKRQQMCVSVLWIRHKVFWMNSASVQADAWLTVSSLSIDSAAHCGCVCVSFIADSIRPQVIVIIETQPEEFTIWTLCICMCVCYFRSVLFIYGEIAAGQMPPLSLTACERRFSNNSRLSTKALKSGVNWSQSGAQDQERKLLALPDWQVFHINTGNSKRWHLEAHIAFCIDLCTWVNQESIYLYGNFCALYGICLQ